MSDQELQPARWVIDTRMNIGHLGTTVLVAMGLVGSYYSQDTRISLLEQKLQDQERYQTAEIVELKEEVRALREDIKDLKDFMLGKKQ